MYLKMTIADKNDAKKLFKAWAKIKEIAIIFGVSSPTIINLIKDKHKKMIEQDKKETLAIDREERLLKHQEILYWNIKQIEEMKKLQHEKHLKLLQQIEEERLELLKKDNYWKQDWAGIVETYYFLN